MSSKARVLADLVAAGGELADGTISVAEVTGAAPIADPTFTGTLTAPTINASTGLQIGGTAITATAADLNGVAGINTNVQTQLDAKSPLASPTFTGTVTVPTLSLGGTSVTTIGTSANSLVQLNGSAQLPAVDGSQLTGISAGTSIGKSFYLATAI
jgi:hypothetical protein